MSKIPTAEEFFKETSPNDEYGLRAKLITLGMQKMIYQIMVRFAKLHVQAALEAASDKATMCHRIYHKDGCVEDTDIGQEINVDTDYYGVFIPSILNSYPLNNIK